MRCSRCDSQIPDEASFCINCGTPIATTGRTIALEQQRDPLTMPPTADLPTYTPRPGGRRRRSLFDGSWRPMARGLHARSGAVLLIGLGILFYTNTWWPWILALIGLTGAIEEVAQGEVRAALVTLLMLGGMAALFATGLFWPGILILIGLVALVDKVRT